MLFIKIYKFNVYKHYEKKDFNRGSEMSFSWIQI